MSMTHGDQPEDSGDQRPSAKVGGAALRPVLVSAVLHAAFLWLALPHASARGPEPRRIEWIDTSIDEGEKLTPAPVGDLIPWLDALGLLGAARDGLATLRRSTDGRGVPLPGVATMDDRTITLLAAGFGRGARRELVVPYARVDA